MSPKINTQVIFWNNTPTPYPDNQTISHLFEAQVARTPTQVALILGQLTRDITEQHLTYEELNQRANQLAHYLASQGIGPDKIVGVYLERSLDLVVALLAILKTGAAYLPLDPTYPLDRLAFMVADSQAPFIITQPELPLPPHQAEVILINTPLPPAPISNLPSQITPDQPMYVIYTSGSTGQPKGVVGLHRGAVNRFHWMWTTYPFAPDEVCCQKTALSFVDSVWEIFGPLLQGVPTVIIPAALAQDPFQLIQLLAQYQVTRLVLVPSLLRAMLDEVKTKHALSLPKYWISSGEALPFDLYQQFKAILPQAILLNLYGSSEVAADATWFDTSLGMVTDFVPIGRPIANMAAYILDETLQPVPVGTPGELYLGGVGLAGGYLHRPELTAEKFIANPFGSGHLYKSGDLAQYLPDGNLQFLGRLDHQVKIRGYRVELGEIEAVLRQHETIKEAIVTLYETAANPQLVAYITTNTESSANFKKWLKTKLPDYMIPSAFVILEQFPLTPNGKIDRQALPNPDNAENRQIHGPHFIPPQTATEHLVAAIWAEVLGLAEISRHDNFFNLGGHSLLATQVSSRLRKTFGVEIMVRHLFEQPTVAELSHLLDTTRHGELSLPPMTVAARSEKLPLSFAQQRLWFLDQMAGPSPTYNLPVALHLQGLLNITALETALNEIIQRHEALRTTFPTLEGVAYQQIAPTLTLTLPLIEATPSDYKYDLTQAARQPFDLATGPLFRAILYRLSETEHVLLLNMHHIISDGWSIGILIEELLTQYYGQPLPALAYQYADFAMWQRNWLQGELLTRQLSYWQEQLVGAPTLLNLPTDHPRPPVQTFNGGLIPFAINAELTTALQQFSRQHDVTLFMTLYAAFAVLLTRYSGQEDVIIGSPIANRHYQEVEPLIGFFVNTLPLRVNLSGQPTFAELLRRVRQLTLAAYSHQDLPFEQLVSELNVPRNLSHTPLFQVMFALDNTPALPQNRAKLQLELVDIDSQIAKFDVTFAVSHHGQQLAATLEYNSDLFEPATITRMAGHLQTLLANIITNPNQSITTLPMLTAAEIEQFQTWNDTTVDYPPDLTIVDLFEAQVKRTPDNIAVIFENESLTYQELNRRANQLAHHLQSLGVGPEVLVGICVERSLEMVIGLLGILKAGGAYVPLDPTNPPERLAFMLQDANVPVLLSQSHLQEQLPPTTAHMVWLDRDWKQFDTYAPENPKTPQNHGHHLAYVIYTSGSTGQPKGALIEHKGLANYLCWAVQAYQVAQGQGAPVHSSISFDLTITALFLPLIVGRRIIVLHKSSGGEALTQILQQQNNFSLVKLTPAHVEILSQQLPTAKIHDRAHYLVIGGEALRSEQLTFWLKHAPQTKLINEYGPTETVVGCSVYEVPINTPPSATIPIGRPIANTQLYVLDAYLQPVPIGVWGELYIGGHGVGRGYLQQPVLTLEHFFELTLTDFGNLGRVYKTGDIVRYLPDGNLEFIGRHDHQVKIRGYRIELGEIEAILGQHDAVQQTVATVPTKGYLVAYVVPKPSHKTLDLLTILRVFLQTKLPDYMIPHRLVMLETLPLTTHGKIDYKALPLTPETKSTTHVGPRNPLEQKIAAIWRELLQVEAIDIETNFFELGGHSLQATQIISKLNSQLQLNLSVKAIFLAPTIEKMAELINQMTVLPQPYQDLLKPELPLIPIPSALKIETRPLLSLLISHRIAPVEAVALSYLEHANPARGELIAPWGAGIPFLTEINETVLGRVAIITLPCFDNALYNKDNSLQHFMVESLHLAKSLDAKVVSLTGLIPSASNYGRSLTTTLAPTINFPTVSTGHATTTAVIILTVERILQASQRNLAQERVACLGLGSIGMASLELLLKTQPHPKELILCDVYSKRTVLEELKHTVMASFNFQGEIKIIQSAGQVPPEFYEATFILGATNVPDILEVNHLHPGTIIVDDSAPHCFNVAAAIQRVESKQDILFTEGGMLKSPEPIQSTLYLPAANDIVLQDYLSTYNPFYITGCVFSSLLSAQLQAQTTIGLVEIEASFQHYELLKKLKFQAADIHCLHYKVPKHLVTHFKQHFGGLNDM